MDTSPASRISRAPRRETVQVTLPDGTTLEGPRGAPLGEFLKAAARPEETSVKETEHDEVPA